MKRQLTVILLLAFLQTIASQELIYVHTDKPYYAPGDTVWFRAHLMDANTHLPTSRSRFVYMELHDQQADTLMQRVVVKRDSDGVFANVMLLPNDIRGGVYTLVAYTQWMRNFPQEHFCYQPLTVVGGLRAQGHRIAEELVAQHSGSASVKGKAATNKGLMTLDIDASLATSARVCCVSSIAIGQTLCTALSIPMRNSNSLRAE